MEHPRTHTVRELISSLLLSNRRHARYLRVLAVLALAVTVIVPLAVRQYGLTKTVTQTVLDCHYDGNGAHTHDASCYDADGNLVCPLAEKPLHTHTEDCYDAEGNLICGLEEVTEEHIHSASCFAEVTVEEPDPEVAMPQRAFSDDVTNDADEQLMKVDVVSPEGALPEDAQMKVALVDPNEVKDIAAQAVAEKTDGKPVELRAVDISFVNSEGREVEPLEKVTVTLAADLIDTNEDYYLVHIDDNGNATVVEPLTAAELAERDIADEANEVVFEAGSFSKYVIVLTTLEKQLTASDGETYDITVDAPAEAGIPQDSELSVTEITSDDEAYDAYLAQALAALGEDADAATLARFFDIKIMNNGEEVQPQAPVRVDIQLADAATLAPDAISSAVHFNGESEDAPEVLEAKQDGAVTSFDAAGFSVYGVIYTVDFQYEGDVYTYDYSIQGGDTLALSELLQALNVEVEGEIADVTFSDPSLMAAIKVEEDVTAGKLKADNDLATRFSAQLRADERAEMDAKELAAGDWALISLKPFDTTEILYVTMDNGDLIKISVTDAQIYTNVITADGASYNIVVTYDDDAQIPDGAELSAREIEKGTIEYNMYLTDTAARLVSDPSSISFARFFDIEISYEGEKIEPQAPVQVSIQYANAMHLDQEEQLSVVHFANEGTEVISDIEMSEDLTEITYEQSSFSVTATVINNPNAQTHDGNAYAVLVKHPTTGDYYAVMNDGSLKYVYFNQSTNTVDLPYPNTWTYITGHDSIADNGIDEYDEHGNYNPPNNLRVEIDARRFDSATQLPIGSVFRYISPAASNGIVDENESSNHGTVKGQNLLWYDANTHTIEGRDWNNNRSGLYVGADFELMHITGRQSQNNAAQIYFAQISSVPGVSANNETVSHIDIGILAEAYLNVPLAYGNYYYDANQQQEADFGEVSRTNNVTLKLHKTDIDVDKYDIMAADLHAYDKDGNELNDAFSIKGYTANEQTTHSAVQVRMDGSFKVSTLDPITSWDNNAANNNPERRSQRLENQVYYKLTLVKDVTFDLLYTDDNNVEHQLYDMYGNKLSVTTTVSLSAGFSYWDENNECPPVLEDWEEKYPFLNPEHNPYGFNNQSWKNGVIINNTRRWGGDSGMDFILGHSAGPDDRVPAVEIVKMIVDEQGNRIKPATNETVVNNFNLYKNRYGAGDVIDYSINPNNPKTSQEIREDGKYDQYSRHRLEEWYYQTIVGPDGIGSLYEYDVESAWYYVEENPAQVAPGADNYEITDNQGTKWTYVETRVETEYAWRQDGDENKLHYADGYSSVPEKLGDYRGSQDEPLWNGFLEFYIYNVYTTYGDLELTKKVTGNGADSSQAFEFTIELTAPTGMTLSSSYPATHTGDSSITSVTPDADGKVVITLKANETFTIEDLPNGTTYTITETPVPGYTPSTTSGDLEGTITGGNNAKVSVEVTNAYSKVDINVIKIDEETRNEQNQTTLADATFALFKFDEDTEIYAAYPDATSNTATTGTDGKIEFTGLVNGKYKIKETQTPPAYVNTSNTELYFTVSANSTVTWTDADGNALTPGTPSGLVDYRPTDKTFIVGNIPGKPLPHTGGIGTTLYTLCGTAMIAAAGYYGLASRRRARKEVA